METVEYKGVEIQIRQEDYPMNPRVDWDNLGKMVCFHGRYDLGDDHDYDHRDYNGWDEMEEAIIKNEKPIVILPLYLYDHSGITMNTTGFSCGWDSGQVGFIFVTQESFDSMFDGAFDEVWRDEHHEGKTDEEILKAILIGEVESYDDYITGNIYGYTIEDELLEDGCTGFFFGYDHEKSGLLEQARACIDAAISSADKLTA